MLIIIFRPKPKEMIMKKLLTSSILALFALFAISANATTLNDSLNHLFNEQQLSQFCASTGIASNTRIKITLPTGTSIFGTITCKTEK